MKYLAYYDIPANKAEKRAFAPAAASKIDYVCTVLNRIDQPVELISASMTSNQCGCKGHFIQLSDQKTLKLFPCMGRGGILKRIFRRIVFQMRIFFYLLVHIKKGEDVLVYHSLGYAGMVYLLRKLKNFRLILEVEEIYTDVHGRERDRKKEYRLFSAADGFIFSTELLNATINATGKPYTLVHGTYQVEPDRGCRIFADDKIHCVYAGTFDPRKGGMVAAASAQFLSEQYHIHILGFGSTEQVKKLQERIAELNQKCKCKISYDGLLRGEDYTRFLQSCDIGLSPQNPDAAFNVTSFPSKILSYMANGLRVVCIRIPAVEASAVGEYMYYYDENTAEAIAKAIKRVDAEDTNAGRKVISQLDNQFEKELRKLLNHEYAES